MCSRGVKGLKGSVVTFYTVWTAGLRSNSCRFITKGWQLKSCRMCSKQRK